MRQRFPLLRFFLVGELLLYAAFLTGDLTGLFDSTLLKYAALLGCLLFCLTCSGGQDGRLTTAALAFTAAADLFLLILDTAYAIGVACFCVVQSLYFLRLRRARYRCLLGGLRAAFCGGTLALLALYRLCTPLTVLTALYFPQLLCNALSSLSLRPSAVSWRLFSVGLWLFVCCDICVGLHNLSSLSGPAAFAVQFGMWLFYLPSQVLIVCSVWKGWFSP